MLNRVGAFVRDVLSVFEKRDGERSNCPRCKGTGLLHYRKPWPWNSTGTSNTPCWFCEGVGAMPLYGLEGFFLGRASALFRTEDLKAPVEAPVKLHLCLGKFPETRCLMKSFKPSKEMKDLLDTQLEPTFWSLHATNVPTLHSRYEGESSDECPTGDDIHHHSETVSKIPSEMSSLDPSGIFFHHDFDVRGKEEALLQLPIHLETWFFQRRDSVKVAQETANFVASETDFRRPARGPLPVTTEEPNFAYPARSEEREESGHVEECRGMSETSRRKRSVKRNQLRAKAEREVAQRALWRKKLKPSKSSETPTHIGPSAPDWSLSGSWMELSSDWLAEETAFARRRAVESSGQSEAEESFSAPGVIPERLSSFASLVLGLLSSSSGV